MSDSGEARIPPRHVADWAVSSRLTTGGCSDTRACEPTVTANSPRTWSRTRSRRPPGHGRHCAAQGGVPPPEARHPRQVPGRRGPGPDGDRRRAGRGGGHGARSSAYRAGQAGRGAGAVLPVWPRQRERSPVMTTGASAHQDRGDLFVADFYPQLGECLAEQHATGYDAGAGRARFLTWLSEHADDDGGDDEEIFVFGGGDDDLPAG